MAIKHPPNSISGPRYGVARVISKLGLASRTRAAQWVAEGRVQVNGRVVRDAEFAVRWQVDRVTVDGLSVLSTAPGTVPGAAPGMATARTLVVMLNKPRGLVTTVADELGRDTVYRCLEGSGLPWLAPVGRLDKASEGLLLFSNDPSWAARITDPGSGPDKTYHAQVDCVADAALLIDLEHGVEENGEFLRAKRVRLLRAGAKRSWLEIILDEGRNRQIRRLLAAFDITVLRLVRVAIGRLPLGELAKGAWRELTPPEIELLMP